jgi:hypothetical protein
VSVLPEGDPHGDREFVKEVAKKRRGKARGAILEPEAWRPEGGGETPPAATSPDGEKPREYRVLRIPRIGKDFLRIYTPCDLTSGVSKPCPVKPLGKKDKAFYFLDPDGQLIELSPNEFGQSHLRGLFGAEADWLNRHFPQFSQQDVWKGFQAQFAAEALTTAAARKGLFDARDKVRGLGCWRGPDGELVQHLGNHVLVDGETHEPGEIGEHVYPGRPKLAPPIFDDEADEDGRNIAGMTVLRVLCTWSWTRRDIDPILLLGWLGCAILGAALDWRPMVFITGDAGTGKSTLQERIKMLLPGRLASTVDASPAALRQIINQDAIGVSFDEIEADMMSDQAQMVLKLARVAASGGTVYRGGKEHNAAEFQLRGCFAFSAIIPPSMRQQDMQRLSFLRLLPLEKGQKLTKRTAAEWRELGQKIAGRMVQGWARWEETLAVYEQALMEDGGHNQRGARQFGTLLASADLILGDEAPTLEAAKSQARGLGRESLYEYEQSEPAWQVAFRRIMQASPEVWRADGLSVAERVRSWYHAQDASDRKIQQTKLNRVGLALVREQGTVNVWLAVDPKHQEVTRIFAQTDMRAHGGEGTWTGVLRGGERYDKKENPGGIWRADNVPALGRAKCTQIRLNATHEVGGEAVPIFDFTVPSED